MKSSRRPSSPPPAQYDAPPPQPRALQPPSNLELFVCQRVSAELQPLLDGWRDAVRRELLSVREASADASDWREAVSAELAELRGEQQRSSESLADASARLAESPPARLQKKIEKQQEMLVASLTQLQEELGETRRTFERTEAGTSKERRQLVKAANDEKATALAAVELERRRAQERIAELEQRLTSTETAARAAGARASNGQAEVGDLRLIAAQHEGAEALRQAAEVRLHEVGDAKKALEDLAARQALQCTILGEAVLEAERDDLARQWASLQAAHQAAAALAACAARHEERRSRSHAEWLAATEAIVPSIATAAHGLVNRLEVVAEHTEGISTGIDAWRGRAIRAEADAKFADETCREAKARARALDDQLQSQHQVLRALQLEMRLLVSELQGAESELQVYRLREREAICATAEAAIAVREVAPLHDAVVALTADLLAPMRTLELDAHATAMRDAEALAQANDRAARAESAAFEAFTSAEDAWRRERVDAAAALAAAEVSVQHIAVQLPPLKEALAASATREAVLVERVAALEKELAASVAAVPVAAAEHATSVSALRDEVVREREAAAAERQAHATERAELQAQGERARLALSQATQGAAAAAVRASEEANANLNAEREAGVAREAAAISAAEAARTALDVVRKEAEQASRKAAEEHTARLAAANARVAERASAFEAEMAKQRERTEAMVADLKATMASQHEVSLRAAQDATHAAAAKAEAAQHSARTAAEHQQQQMRSLTREHAAALRADRQLAAQELAAARERAEDAERRLESARHSALATQQLAFREVGMPRDGSVGQSRRSAARATGLEAVEQVEQIDDEEWHAARRQHDSLMNDDRTNRASEASLARGGASAALLRRAAMLSEGTPRTAGRV